MPLSAIPVINFIPTCGESDRDFLPSRENGEAFEENPPVIGLSKRFLSCFALPTTMISEIILLILSDVISGYVRLITHPASNDLGNQGTEKNTH